MPTPRKAPNRLKRKVREYTDLERAHALAALASAGGNLAEASRLTAIPERTIAAWRERPMTGQQRATVAVREQLMGQMFERIIWRLAREVKGKLSDAKLPALLNGIGTLFDRLRLLRANPTTPEADLVPGGLDLSRLTADELRQLLDLVSRAGGDPSQLGATEGAIVRVVAEGVADVPADVSGSVYGPVDSLGDATPPDDGGPVSDDPSDPPRVP